MGEEEVQHSAMQKALQNPIILTKIFQNDHRSGKAIRLVCHQWNDLLLSLPLPKLTLRLYPDPKSSPKFKFHTRNEFYTDCCNATPFLLFCIKMEPRLARRIEEHGCILRGGYLQQHPPPQRIGAAEARLLHFSVHNFNLVLEDLTITFADSAVNPTLYEILRNFCPNLKRLKIQCAAIGDEEGFQDAQDAEVDFDVPRFPLLIRPKLSLIEIKDLTILSRFFDMTKLILRSAPNLTHFKYYGNDYPDLSKNVSIKRIDLTVKTTKVPNRREGVYGINQMLDKVKDRLEILHIYSKMVNEEDETSSSEDEADYEMGDDEEYEYPDFLPPIVKAARIRIPEMKNLKEFGNDMLDLFRCGDQLEDICTARIPTLQNLEISTIKKKLDVLLRTVIHEEDLFSGVKQLHVTDVWDPKLIAGLKTPFPNLESLIILEWRNESELGPLTILLTESYLEACASLGLKKLTLELPNNHYKLSEFVNKFPNCNELGSRYPGGLKTITLKLRLRDGISDDMDLIEDGVAKMKRCLFDMKGFGNVYMSKFWFKKETWKWMEPFIQENKIPIEFN